MKKIIFITGLIMMLSGCYWKNIKTTEYYESGQVKKVHEDTSEGFIAWSEGAGKQMPLSNIDISGVGL